SNAAPFEGPASRPPNTSLPGSQTCSATGSTITCNRPALSAGNVDTITLTLNTSPCFADTPTNSAPLTLAPSISSPTTPQGDATANDDQTLTFDVISRADLSISKTQTTPSGLPANTIYANANPAQNSVVYTVA